MQGFNLLHLSLPKRLPLFILASSICWPLQCLISTLTQRGGGGHFCRLWGGSNSACTYHWYHWRLWGAFAVSRPPWVCPPLTACVLSPSTLLRLQVALQGNCLKWALGCPALPRSKPLRFRFSGTPQRRRLGGAGVLCPSQVWATQVTRCLASAVAPSWRLHLLASPVPAARFSGCTAGVHSQVCRVSPLGSWSLAATLLADVDCPESQEVLVSNKACLQFGRWCLSGATIAPFWLWLPSPACLWRGVGLSTASQLCSVLCSVSGPGGVLG